jgi:hypothetical protein
MWFDFLTFALSLVTYHVTRLTIDVLSPRGWCVFTFGWLLELIAVHLAGLKLQVGLTKAGALDQLTSRASWGAHHLLFFSAFIPCLYASFS